MPLRSVRVVWGTSRDDHFFFTNGLLISNGHVGITALSFITPRKKLFCLNPSQLQFQTEVNICFWISFLLAGTILSERLKWQVAFVSLCPEHLFSSLLYQPHLLKNLEASSPLSGWRICWKASSKCVTEMLSFVSYPLQLSRSGWPQFTWLEQILKCEITCNIPLLENSRRSSMFQGLLSLVIRQLSPSRTVTAWKYTCSHEIIVVVMSGDPSNCSCT